jgi:hypothetical protein
LRSRREDKGDNLVPNGVVEGRTYPGEKHERKPEVIAVFVEEGAFGAIDDGRHSPGRRNISYVFRA